MTPPAASRLSVGSPTQFAVLVPHLLGFMPTESLVVVAVSGPRRRLGLALRIDLPAPADRSAAAGQIVDTMLASGAEALVVAVFTDELPGAGRLPQQRLVAQVAACGVPIVEAILVGHGRCRSYLCDDEECCPLQGRPLTRTAEADRIAAAFVGVGSGVLSSRAELVDSLQPVTGSAAELARAAVDAGRTWLREVGHSAALAWLDEWLGATLAAGQDPRACPDPAGTGRFIVLLARIPVRDAVLARWVRDVAGDRDSAEVWRRLLAHVVTVALPPHDAPVCTLFAIAAYQAGDGVLAAAALERAHASQPAYLMAELIGSALGGQLPPPRLLEMLQFATRTC